MSALHNLKGDIPIEEWKAVLFDCSAQCNNFDQGFGISDAKHLGYVSKQQLTTLVWQSVWG